MLLTEEQAREKWCPRLQIRSLYDALLRHDTTERHHSGEGCCIASQCMAWRWADPEFETNYTTIDRPDGDGWELGPEDEAPEFMGQFYRRPRMNRRGYCGLAGR